MAKYFRRPGEVEANQFFYGRAMIPGVVYPADRSEGLPGKHAYIFVDDNDNKQFLVPGDWVVMEDDDDGNLVFYVVKPNSFDLLFAEEDAIEGRIMKIDHSVRVHFLMWGQKCETVFDNQEDALKWLATVTPKGWCLPDRITTMEGTVLMKNPELNNKVDQ